MWPQNLPNSNPTFFLPHSSAPTPAPLAFFFAQQPPLPYLSSFNLRLSLPLLTSYFNSSSPQLPSLNCSNSGVSFPNPLFQPPLLSRQIWCSQEAEHSSPVQPPPAPAPAPTLAVGPSSLISPPLPSGSPTDTTPGEWLLTPSSKQRFQTFSSKSISVFYELDVQFFAFGNLGFYEKLIKDNCLGLLTFGNVVYPRLVQLFYTNLELKSTSDGVSVESSVKGVKIALDC